ncbi:Rhodanese-like domain-containing protein [Xylariaceae sp. FL0594]|nr:Rhodanese-like domain-containing protein [Xylariaceae sp. FL0594]
MSSIPTTTATTASRRLLLLLSSSSRCMRHGGAPRAVVAFSTRSISTRTNVAAAPRRGLGVVVPGYNTLINGSGSASGNRRGLSSGGGVKRWSSTSATGSKIWTFEEIQSLTSSSPQKQKQKQNQKQKPTLLIDVREPSELSQTGKIPGSINIPITSSPDSFSLSPEDFEDRFGFPPPDKEGDEVVFYCKAGVRSRAAAALAREAGYKNVGEYPGSWIEWHGKGGEVER